jgi:hypothetical protein
MKGFTGLPIDYLKINAALVFYKSLGYSYIEVPWMVNEIDIEETLPARNFRLEVHGELDGSMHSMEIGCTENNGCLIGSAEQGFVHLMRRGDIGPGERWVSASPCFRREQKEYEAGMLQPYFFKVELVEVTPVPQAAVDRMVAEAIRCFRTFGGWPKAVTTEHGVDLMLGNIEVGSYGYRESPDGHRWAYGTGLAEPRFSYALKRFTDEATRN